MKKFVTAIPNNILNGILLAHAFCGCDTTSSIFDVGQVRIVKERLIDIDIIASFYSSSTSRKKITQAGEKLMFQLYTKSMMTSSTDLNELRYEIHCKKLGTKDMKRKIQSNSLPPTSDATAQHSLRVYHAVQAWIGVRKDPEMYGWQIVCQ